MMENTLTNVMKKATSVSFKVAPFTSFFVLMLSVIVLESSPYGNEETLYDAVHMLLVWLLSSAGLTLFTSYLFTLKSIAEPIDLKEAFRTNSSFLSFFFRFRLSHEMAFIIFSVRSFIQFCQQVQTVVPYNVYMDAVLRDAVLTFFSAYGAVYLVSLAIYLYTFHRNPSPKKAVALEPPPVPFDFSSDWNTLTELIDDVQRTYENLGTTEQHTFDRLVSRDIPALFESFEVLSPSDQNRLRARYKRTMENMIAEMQALGTDSEAAEKTLLLLEERYQKNHP